MNKAMKFMCKLSYKLGQLSTKTPTISTQPVKLIINHFKQGREHSKPIKPTEFTFTKGVKATM